MSLITKNRITRFCRDTLDALGGKNIGFVDIGSGGDLKAPWALLPTERLTTFDFEPTRFNGETLPLCISNKNGPAPFYVANNERASSLHKPRADFIDRFRFDRMFAKETITVACSTLDEYFADRYDFVDAMDINVEGHDFQVLQGGDKLLAAGVVKLIKIEFELAAVYEGQGYLSDIDAFLRARNFRLANIQVEELRPAKVRHLSHKGESIWGKALYVPNQDQLKTRLGRIHGSGGRKSARQELASMVALYTASELLGSVYDAIEHAEAAAVITASEGQHFREQINHAFQWARLEMGMIRFGELASAVLHRFFPKD